MDINQLIAIVKTKLTENIVVEDIKIEDKSFLHQKHVSHQIGKFHLKLTIHSKELKKIKKNSKNFEEKKKYRVYKSNL